MRQHARRVVAAAVVALAACCPVAGAEAPPQTDAPVTPSPIDALVAQLSHDDWKLREKAQQELARFGPAAAARLEALLAEANDPELRARAEGVLEQIARNDATGPTFVTLRLKEATAAEAFDDLARQAGAKVETQPPALFQRQDLPRVTIDVERQPFWEVMRQVCAACRLRPERSGGGKLVLTADDGSWARRPFVTSGPFLVTANELYVTRGVRFGADAEAAAPAPGPGLPPAPVRRPDGFAPDDVTKDHAQLQIAALFEPKLHGMAWAVGNVVDATDDAGRSLVLLPGAAPQRRSVYGGSRTGQWEGTVWLGVPDDGRKARLARLKFLTTFTVRTGVETFEIPDILAAKDVERMIGPTRVVVKGVTRLPNDQYELNITSAPSSDLQAWRAVNAVSTGPGPRLVDADGRDFPRSGSSTTLNVEGHTQQLRFAPDRGPAGANGRVPAKMVWELPTGVQQFQVPVEFENLPLP